MLIRGRPALINFSTPCAALNQGRHLLGHGTYSTKYGIYISSYKYVTLSQNNDDLITKHKAEGPFKCQIVAGLLGFNDMRYYYDCWSITSPFLHFCMVVVHFACLTRECYRNSTSANVST